MWRISHQQPAPRRHAISLIVESLRKNLGQVLYRRRTQQLGVNGGDAVSTVRADNRQIGHSDFSSIAFFDEAHPLNAPAVTRETAADIIEQSPIDLVDDLEMTGSTISKKRTGHLSNASGNNV